MDDPLDVNLARLRAAIARRVAGRRWEVSAPEIFSSDPMHPAVRDNGFFSTIWARLRLRD